MGIFKSWWLVLWLSIKCSGWLGAMYVSGYVSGYIKKMGNSCIDSILVQGCWKHAVGLTH